MLALGPPDILRVDAQHIWQEGDDLNSKEGDSRRTQTVSNLPSHLSDRLLLVEATLTGDLVLCVGTNFVTVLACNGERDWTPVGSCRRPSFGKSFVDASQAAWNADGSSFAICNSHGIAEFYDVSKLDKVPIRISRPGWLEDTYPDRRAANLRQVQFRCSVKSTVEGESISLHSVVQHRLWLLMGTSRGSIVRVLWTGEVVIDREVDAMPGTAAKATISQLSIGWQQRVGFVSATGCAGVYSRTEDSTHVYHLCEKDAMSIAMHRNRPLALVGFRLGTINVYAVGRTAHRVLRRIAFPVHELPQHLDARASVRRSGGDFATSNTLRWCPDGSNFFVVGYTDVGLMVWSSTGAKATSILLSKAALDEEIVTQPKCAWALKGYALVTKPSHSSECPGGGGYTVSFQDFVKSCTGPQHLIGGTTSMCLQGWNYILALQNQEWDVNSLSWRRVDVPGIYLRDNWPIRSATTSMSGNLVAVSAAHGFAVYSHTTKRWNIIDEFYEDKAAPAFSHFWWGDEFLFVIQWDASAQSWELLAYQPDELRATAVLGRVHLPSRPVGFDTLYAENILVVQFHSQLCVFHVQSSHNIGHVPETVAEDPGSASEGEEDSPYRRAPIAGAKRVLDPAAERSCENQPHKPARRHFVFRRASSATHQPATHGIVTRVSITLQQTVELSFLDNHEQREIPMALCVMPCGATRRAGIPIRFPKCAVLTSSGDLYVVDTDEGLHRKVCSGVFRIMPQSWSKIDQSDDIVLESVLERNVRRDHESGVSNGSLTGILHRSPSGYLSYEGTPKLPAALLYTIWILDAHGLRLWLPALDPDAEQIDTRGAAAYWDVLPLGVLETHGLVVGISQRSRNITQEHLPCYEMSVRVSPSTHGILQWLVQAGRQDLASQVLVQASTHLPLFQSTLDLFLFNVVETDFKHRDESPAEHRFLLPDVISLLRKGKIAAILNSRAYDTLVITCARKMETSRWDLFFKWAGNPEQIFNDSIYAGDLRTAAGSMVVADYFTPNKSSRRIAALAHAAKLQEDEGLLAELDAFRLTKLS